MKALTKKFEVLGFLLAGVLLFSLTQKLPNWRWMGQRDDPYFSMFDTGLSIFRPWLPLEALEWRWWGQNWFSDNLVYGLLGGWALYLLYRNVGRRLPVFMLTAPPLALALWYTAKGGTLYDVTVLFALVFLMYALHPRTNEYSLPQLLGIGILLAILDLSRPFAFNIVILFGIYLIYRLRWRAAVPLYAFLILAGPFHIHQLLKFNSFELSTYGGNNLIEALDANYLAADDCYIYEKLQQLDSYEAAQCAASNKQKVFADLAKQPSMLFQTINTQRLQKILFPQLVWHATGLNPQHTLQRAMQMVFNTWLLAIYALLFWALMQRQSCELRIYQALLSLIAIYIIGITLVANRLSEVLRVSIPALAALTMVAQTARIGKWHQPTLN